MNFHAKRQDLDVDICRLNICERIKFTNKCLQTVCRKVSNERMWFNNLWYSRNADRIYEINSKNKIKTKSSSIKNNDDP